MSAALLDMASFTTLAAACPWPAGIWLGADEAVDGAALAGLLLRASAARLVPRRAGMLAAVALGPLLSGATPVARYTTPEIVDRAGVSETPSMAGRLQRHGYAMAQVKRSPNSTAQLGVQRLDGIGGVEQPPDLQGKGIERHHLAPGAAPALADGGISAAPGAGLERRQGRLRRSGVNRPVDVLQCRCHWLAVLPGDEIQAVAQQMDYAGLHHGLGEHRPDRLGRALQPVHHRKQNILDAAVAQLPRSKEYDHQDRVVSPLWSGRDCFQ